MVFSFAIALSFGQGTQRMVLWEEFTSGSCGPCAGVNPQITAYWNNNPNTVVGIQYHMSWPAANDPMYLNNTGDNNARRGVYGVNSIPFAAIDGDRFANNVNNVNSIINIVENAYNNDPSPFDLQLHYELNDTEDQLLITVMVTAAQEVSGLNARLHLPVVEKHIHLASPQPNGEQDFYNVMKALVPSSSGTLLKSDWEENDYEIFQFTWDIFGFYDINQVGLIGFIQNSGSSLGVQQAGYGSVEPLTPNYATDMAVTKIETVQVLCNNAVSPLVTIRNQGSEAITSATIKYYINDGEEHTFDWTGNLNFMESTEIQLPEVNYDFADSYDINVVIENPNSINDDYNKNNHFVSNIPQSAFLPQNCKVAILTDDNPEETTWDIKNSTGEIIASGGPYTMTTIYIEPFTWPANDCYTFSIYDEAGNGLDGGFYRIVNSSNQLIWAGNEDFGYGTSAEFAYDELMDVQKMPTNDGISVYPNPVLKEANIEFTLQQQSMVQVGIYNLLGKRIIQIYDGILAAGPQNYQINAEGLESGVYLLKTEINGETMIQKINVSK